MGKYDKLLFRILRGLSDENIEFDELCHLVESLGFDARTKGSHHIFRKGGIPEKINLQRHGAKAKPYQVKQVRTVLQKYRLAQEE